MLCKLGRVKGKIMMSGVIWQAVVAQMKLLCKQGMKWVELQ